MKKLFTLIIAIIALASCSSDSYVTRNPYLNAGNFSVAIDMNLPLYNNLLYTANPVVVSIDGYGINGLILMNTGSGYVAWENSCPNQELSSCSLLRVNGTYATCPCDSVQYSLFTGQPTTAMKYNLKAYRVEILSNTAIRVYN
nr:hypothetical protein [uncultured Flavobacterium sp.]